MYAYHVALYLHILALVLASGATFVTKLADGRRARARTVGEALDWHNVLTGASKLFPISLAVFVVTGSYMLSVARLHVWSNGFVVAGLAGAAFLFASGAFLGIKGRALEKVLENMAREDSARPAPPLVPPGSVALLPVVNTGIALSVVFDMVAKPTSIPVALGVIAIGMAVPTGIAMRRWPLTAAKSARTNLGASLNEEPRAP
jgi:hypothetical protein